MRRESLKIGVECRLSSFEIENRHFVENCVPLLFSYSRVNYETVEISPKFLIIHVSVVFHLIQWCPLSSVYTRDQKQTLNTLPLATDLRIIMSDQHRIQ